MQRDTCTHTHTAPGINSAEEEAAAGNELSEPKAALGSGKWETLNCFWSGPNATR